MGLTCTLLLALVAQQPPAQLTKPPELVQYVEAPYPAEAEELGLEGTVVLTLDVDAEGLVQRVELVESAGFGFDEAAMNAAAGFVFSPAEAGELGPVPVKITYRYGFVLQDPTATTTATVATATAADPVAPKPPDPINFRGTVLEAGFRKPVAFANVTVSIANTATVTRTSTQSDDAGRFAFRGLPAGQHVVTVRAPFFERLDTKERVRDGEVLEVVYFATRAERDPYEVVVRAKLPRKEVSRTTLRFEDVERLPGTQGDAIRVVQNLPGVSRTPFGVGLLVVRGAPPQDTGVFLDGHRLPLLFHFGGLGGLTSVVYARALEGISFAPGGFGPRQGRISAGIVELDTKFAATDRVHGEAVVDIAGASVFLEGPVSSDPNDGAFTIALRRSYVDGVLAGVLSALDASATLAPRYYDYQVRYDRPVGGDDKRMFSLLAYGSDDEILLLGSTTQASGAPEGTQSRTFFHRINPSFTYRPDTSTWFRISPILGYDFTNTQTSGDPSGNNIQFRLSNVNGGVRVDGKSPLAENLRLTAGGDFLYFRFDTDSTLPVFPAIRDFPSPLPTDTALREDKVTVPAVLGSAYAELEYQPFEALRIWPGVRFDLYSFDAVADVNSAVDPRLVEGRSLFGFDPRLSARYTLTDSVSLKAQAGLYQQPPLPTQFYVNADLPLLKAQQYSGGFEWQIIDRLSLDLVGFHRYQSNVPRFSGDTEVVDGVVRLVGFRPDGLRRSYGAEMLLKLEKRWGLFGWIAYTLSRSEFRRRDEEWGRNLYFDQTHNVNVVASYDLGLNWTLSMRFRYVTGGGLPTTTYRHYDADEDQYDRETGDLQRAPAFHQLDVRIDKRWIFDSWYLEAYLDINNVYNRSNTEIYVPSFDFKEEVAIPSLPFFPLIGFKGVF